MTPFPQSSDFAFAAIKLGNESHRMLAPYHYVYDAKVARDAGNYFIVNLASLAELADAHDSPVASGSILILASL